MDLQAVLKRPPQGSIRYDHPWIYRNQIKEIDSRAEPGDVVSVVTESGKFMGKAYWNPKSQISLRVLTRLDEVIDESFFRSRIQNALNFRADNVHQTNAFRVISSEADDLPGLIVDRYADVLVVQILTLGMEKNKKVILSVLGDIFSDCGIFERSDASSRSLEGLEESIGWIDKKCGDKTLIYEGDIEILMDFGHGHKTGWYLDQRENRFILREEVCPGLEVLDVFCYEGGFSLQLAKAGASVLGVDSQKDVILRASEHRSHNKISEKNLVFEASNAFERMKDLEKSGRKFDCVILDPPSFVKQKNALSGALSGYRELLLRAFRMIRGTGKLAVFSCAYHLDDHFLMQVSMVAAQDAKRRIKVLKFLKQSADHPINPFIPETYYLKGYLFQVS